MSSGRELKVTILGDDAELRKTFQSTEASTQHMSSVMDGAAKQVQRLKEALLGLFALNEIKFALESVVGSAVTFTLDVQKMTAALNNNAEQGSLWVAVAEKMGIETTMLSRAFSNVSKEAETGKGVLINMGIATQDAAGHLRPMNDLLMEAVDWFHANAGASNEATYAQQIFGKSSGQILALLEQGRGSFEAIKEEAQRYGLILNNDVLERQLAMTYQMRIGEQAVKALQISLGEALMPALAALGQGLANFVANHLQQFINAVNTAVSWVIGLGIAFGFWDESASKAAQNFSNVTTATNDFGTAAPPAASAGHALADATKAIRDAARDATQAIDEQTRGIDKQIKSLQDAQKASDFEAKQTAIKQQEADKQKQIDDLKITYAYDVWAGNLSAARTTQDRITALIAEKAKLEVEYNKNASAEVTADKIDALNQQKSVLAEQKRSIQDAAQSQIEAMQQAGAGSVAAQRTASLAIPPFYAAAGKDAAAKFKFAVDSTAVKNAEDFGNKIRTALQKQDWKTFAITIGTEIGTALGNAAATEIGKILAQKVGLQHAGNQSVHNIPAKDRTWLDWIDWGLTGGPLNDPQNSSQGGPGAAMGPPTQQRLPAPTPSSGADPNASQGGPGAAMGPPSTTAQLDQANTHLATIANHIAAIRNDSGPLFSGQSAIQQAGG